MGFQRGLCDCVGAGSFSTLAKCYVPSDYCENAMQTCNSFFCLKLLNSMVAGVVECS